MQPDHLTYQWLTPILISIIGFFVVYYLKAMKDQIQDIDNKFTKHVDKIEASIDLASERHYKIEMRVNRLEDHIISK
jgi:hypothetical protein